MGNTPCCANRGNDPSHMMPSSAPGDPAAISRSGKRSKNDRDILVDRTFKNVEGSNKFSKQRSLVDPNKLIHVMSYNLLSDAASSKES